MVNNNLFQYNNFILATRDSGYKKISSALSELIDNSFEANANNISIIISEIPNELYGIYVAVMDDGEGMDYKTLRLALQFGGSTRYNSRKGNGRYGMGLPNGSLSQSKRVEVYTWQNKNKIIMKYLDADEIIQGGDISLSSPKHKKCLPYGLSCNSESGTVVVWNKCDRFYTKIKALRDELYRDLGQLFRNNLWGGKVIKINDLIVEPFDPLFIKKGSNLKGAILYGDVLEYRIKNTTYKNDNLYSIIKVRFSELPVNKWSIFTNEEKNRYCISKKAGISILRAGREIDYGWYFMGSKRKENYDDWWRCEIDFPPELDELFGVTHTKQEIHPTNFLEGILTKDVEASARELNKRVRNKFLEVKKLLNKSTSQKIAEMNDHLLELPMRKKNFSLLKPGKSKRMKYLKGLTYKIDLKEIEQTDFYIPRLNKNNLKILINKNHLFFKKIYSNVNVGKGQMDIPIIKEFLDLLLFSISRAEYQIKEKESTGIIEKFKTQWSNILSNYLQ